MKNITKSLAIIAVVVLGVAGATYAYFTKQGQVAGAVATGTIDLAITNQNSNAAFSFQMEKLAPGEERLLNLDIKNTGTLPEYLRGAIIGRWEWNSLHNNANDALVSIVKVERWNGSSWQTLVGSGPVTGVFYYSPNGNESSLYAVNPGEKAQLQLTVKLSGAAGNEFQGKNYNATIQVGAKQTTAEATWN